MDEIELYKKERFISAMRAAWRLRKYSVTRGFEMQQIKILLGPDSWLSLWADHIRHLKQTNFKKWYDPVAFYEYENDCDAKYTFSHALQKL